MLDTVNEDAIDLSEIIPNDSNTLNVSTITVPHPDNILASQYVTAQQCGPMVDDGFLYIEISSTELQLLISCKTLDLDQLPEQIKHFIFWLLVFGKLASTTKPILGSATIRFTSNQGI